MNRYAMAADSRDEQMEIDHIGYVVKDIHNAINIFYSMGFSTVKAPVFDSIQNLWIALIQNENQMIELISPDEHRASVVNRFLSANGPTPYHLCFRTESIEKENRKLIAQGFRMISEISPAIVFDGKRVVFLYHQDMIRNVCL
jgi:methylmalonyl-CoA/ethylmalonyl-CoA epimerase